MRFNYAPADDIPFIGSSPLEENVYIATGFSADGLVYGTAASIIISDLITGKPNSWAKTFDPKRFTPVASAKKILNENLDIVTNFIKDYFLKGTEKEFENIRAGEGRIVEYKGEKSAAFRDEQGGLHVVSAKCPHMGCIVHWNNGEKSWDCPCHGSRFSVDGIILEGPAYGDLEKYATK